MGHFMHCRTLRGIADPHDPSHFTVRREVFQDWQRWGEKGVVVVFEGWLKYDGSFRFRENGKPVSVRQDDGSFKDSD